MTTNIEQQENELLQPFKLPGKKFTLPSKGIFYEPGVLADSVEDGIIHIKMLGSYDEIQLKNPDLLYSGEAIINVCKECIPEILKPEELLKNDVEAILLYLRLVTYGEEYRFSYFHQCKEDILNELKTGQKIAKTEETDSDEKDKSKIEYIYKPQDNEYKINLESFLTKIKYIDEKTFKEDDHSLKLPNKQIVIFQPISNKDYIKLVQEYHIKGSKNNINDEITIKELYDFTLDLTILTIKGVKPDTKSEIIIKDRDKIREWYKQLPTPYINKILENNKINRLFGVDLDYSFHCKDCKEKINIELPIDPVRFFNE